MGQGRRFRFPIGGCPSGTRPGVPVRLGIRTVDGTAACLLGKCTYPDQDTMPGPAMGTGITGTEAMAEVAEVAVGVLVEAAAEVVQVWAAVAVEV